MNRFIPAFSDIKECLILNSGNKRYGTGLISYGYSSADVKETKRQIKGSLLRYEK